ncbi:LOW QUALITY PROTEIN: B1 bradykinin receptor-like [Porphyrio hochstetteri]
MELVYDSRQAKGAGVHRQRRVLRESPLHQDARCTVPVPGLYTFQGQHRPPAQTDRLECRQATPTRHNNRTLTCWSARQVTPTRHPPVPFSHFKDVCCSLQNLKKTPKNQTETPLLNVPSSNQSENKSNSTICLDLNDCWEIVTFIVPKYISTTCIIGIIGNVFVIFTYSLHKGPLKTAEINLMGLALAELFCLTCLLFWAENIKTEFSWPLGNFLCCGTSISISLNIYTSIYLLVTVSMDYTSLHTFNHRGIGSKSMAKGICSLSWFFSILCFALYGNHLPYFFHHSLPIKKKKPKTNKRTKSTQSKEL